MLYLDMFALVGFKKSECAWRYFGSSPSYNRVMQITQETIARCSGVVYQPIDPYLGFTTIFTKITSFAFFP